MSNKGRYSHISSFNDFKKEKLQLHYSIKLTEKKLELTLFNIRTHLSIEKVIYNLLLNNVVDPLFLSVKNMIVNWFKKLKESIGTGTKEKEADKDKVIEDEKVK